MLNMHKKHENPAKHAFNANKKEQAFTPAHAF